MNKLKLSAAVAAILAVCVGAAVAASSPTVTTSPATSVTDTSGVLNGAVNPNGSTTTYGFQYGLTPAYGSLTKSGSAGSGTKTVLEKITLTGLTPGTTYYYRFVASNKSGASFGSGRTFKTSGNPPPGATTEPATNIGRNTATLNGIIEPENQATTWYFQYGLQIGYSVETFGGTVPAGAAPVSVSDGISGLEPGTTFHYRLIAFHDASELTPGLDVSFETFPFPRPVPKVFGSTSPRTADSSPFNFITTGHVQNSGPTPAAQACVGTVTVSYVLGHRALKKATVPLQPNCTFAAAGDFGKRLPGSGPKGRIVKLSVKIHWGGNDYLAPSDARVQTITLK